MEEEKALGHFAPSSHPKTRPDLAEAEAVDRLLKLAKAAEAPVIVVHLSTAAGYELSLIHIYPLCRARQVPDTLPYGSASPRE